MELIEHGLYGIYKTLSLYETYNTLILDGILEHGDLIWQEKHVGFIWNL